MKYEDAIKELEDTRDMLTLKMHNLSLRRIDVILAIKQYREKTRGS